MAVRGLVGEDVLRFFLVGDLVGEDVLRFFLVGDLVGGNVFPCFGDLVGFKVGARVVGWDVGARVVGFIVGLMVGLMFGLIIGCIDGILTGLTVGSFVALSSSSKTPLILLSPASSFASNVSGSTEGSTPSLKASSLPLLFGTKESGPAATSIIAGIKVGFIAGTSVGCSVASTVSDEYSGFPLSPCLIFTSCPSSIHIRRTRRKARTQRRRFLKNNSLLTPTSAALFVTFALPTTVLFVVGSRGCSLSRLSKKQSSLISLMYPSELFNVVEH